jgi:type IV fimbrial biogenesis protein FimT
MVPPECTPAVDPTRSGRGPGGSAGAGFTLIELLVTLSLLALLLALAAPSFEDFLLRRRLEGQSARWLADLQHLRSTAVGRRQALRLTWLADEQGSGWLIHSGDADACALEPGGDGSLRCDEGTLVLRSHWLPLASRLRVQANVVSMRVDPRQGTFSPTGSWEVSSGEQHRLRHVVNLLGRTRLCTPELRLPGVPPC